MKKGCKNYVPRVYIVYVCMWSTSIGRLLFSTAQLTSVLFSRFVLVTAVNSFLVQVRWLGQVTTYVRPRPKRSVTEAAAARREQLTTTKKNVLSVIR